MGLMLLVIYHLVFRLLSADQISSTRSYLVNCGCASKKRVIVMQLSIRSVAIRTGIDGKASDTTFKDSKV